MEVGEVSNPPEPPNTDASTTDRSSSNNKNSGHSSIQSWSSLFNKSKNSRLQPNLTKVNIGEDTTDIGLDYEWQPEVCDTCKIFGHSNAKCPKNKAKDVQAQDTAKQVQTQHTQVIRHKRQTMRWTPKKYAQNGQTSCLRDDEGAPIPPEGLTKDSPVIISEDRAQVPEGTNKENETLDSEGGSHIVVHTGVHATNRFEVLMTNDNDEMKDVDDAQFNSLEIVPYVRDSLIKEKELQQEEHFEEVRTDFEFTEVVQVTEKDEEGLPEVDTEEMNAYSIKRSYVQQEGSISTSEEELEKEYFSDHLSSEEDQEIAGMIVSPPVTGINVKMKHLTDHSELSKVTDWKKAKSKKK